MEQGLEEVSEEQATQKVQSSSKLRFNDAKIGELRFGKYRPDYSTALQQKLRKKSATPDSSLLHWSSKLHLRYRKRKQRQQRMVNWLNISNRTSHTQYCYRGNSLKTSEMEWQTRLKRLDEVIQSSRQIIWDIKHLSEELKSELIVWFDFKGGVGLAKYKHKSNHTIIRWYGTYLLLQR